MKPDGNRGLSNRERHVTRRGLTTSNPREQRKTGNEVIVGESLQEDVGTDRNCGCVSDGRRNDRRDQGTYGTRGAN